MEIELGPVLSAALFIIEEINRTELPPNVLTEVNEVEAQIVKGLPIISTYSNSSHLRQVATAEPPHREPVFAQKTGAEISLTPAPSDLPPTPPHAETSFTSSSSVQGQTGTDEPGKKSKKP